MSQIDLIEAETVKRTFLGMQNSQQEFLKCGYVPLTVTVTVTLEH